MQRLRNSRLVDQSVVSKAVRAAATAACMSAAVPSATTPSTSSVAGLMLSNVPPPVASTSFPPMSRRASPMMLPPSDPIPRIHADVVVGAPGGAPVHQTSSRFSTERRPWL